MFIHSKQCHRVEIVADTVEFPLHLCIFMPFFPILQQSPLLCKHDITEEKKDLVYNLGVTPLKGNIISSGGMCGKDEQMQEFKWRLIA